MSEDFPTLDLPIKAYSGSPVVGHLFTRLLLMTNSAEVMTIVTILCYTKLFYRTKIRHCKHIAQTGKKWLGERESGKGSHGEEEGKESKPSKKRTEGQARRGKKGKQKWATRTKERKSQAKKEKRGRAIQEGKERESKNGQQEQRKGRAKPREKKKEKKVSKGKKEKHPRKESKKSNQSKRKPRNQERKKSRNQSLSPSLEVSSLPLGRFPRNP